MVKKGGIKLEECKEEDSEMVLEDSDSNDDLNQVSVNKPT